MDQAAVGFLGVLVGALIGWFAGLAVARRSRDYAIELWQRDRDARAEDIRKALGEEMRANIALLTTAREKSHHAVTERAAWLAAAGMRFRQDQSREFALKAYVAAAQYDTAVRQIPALGSGNIRGEATNLCLDLAKAALDTFTEAERLYVANGEDPARPPRRR